MVKHFAVNYLYIVGRTLVGRARYFTAKCPAPVSTPAGQRLCQSRRRKRRPSVNVLHRITDGRRAKPPRDAVRVGSGVASDGPFIPFWTGR